MNSNFTKIIRFILGLILIVFGANKLIMIFNETGFMSLITMPANLKGSIGSIVYILPVVGALEVYIAVLLILKKWVPFALILLAPISVNILLFHFFLDLSSGMIGALVVALLNGILIYKHWPQFKPLFY
ncbi:DoxX protein [Kordia sp. YSTF-M3]|uniref:DoxX protein n=1 Tax=Kordia aestuariivivens TaxID=2759037 RepID=A0ABR7QEY9_9FLAO|nr:DoxX protein [Kordia aestuariivivens]MBC8756983.1 DoxX protein [Kordia aestuariivivens]